MHTRLVEQTDGKFLVYWSEDAGKSWHHEPHKNLWVKKIAEKFAKNEYPQAKFVGTIKAS